MHRTALLSILACGLCWAQADDSQPASSNVRGAAYPRVHADLSVTFRLLASAAKKVQLKTVSDENGLGKGPFDLTRGEDGVWALTTPSTVPGFHYYWFLVDGVAVNDPGSETYFGWAKESSGVEVPEKGADFYAVKEVAHGDVRVHWYFAKTTAAWRRAYVYTPAEYDRNTQARYPVLYLQHGSGEDARGDKPRPREFHSGQPDRRRENQADDRRHGARLCHQAGASRGGDAGGRPRRTERRFRGSGPPGPDPGDRCHLPDAPGQGAPRLGGAVHGRRASAPDWAHPPGPVRLDRIVQFPLAGRPRSEDGVRRGIRGCGGVWQASPPALVRRRPGRNADARVGAADAPGARESGHQERVLRIARHVPRMADLAPGSVRVRSPAFPVGADGALDPARCERPENQLAWNWRNG